MKGVIGLCVYNNSEGLPRALINIDKINLVFKELQIIAFYDKSSDNSLEILEKYSYYKNNMEIIINTNERSEIRTENIAFARNSILKKIREKYKNYKYFMMMDTNNYSCIGDINIDVLRDVMNRSYEWDSISFDREAGYYDTWALSFDPFIYSSYHCDNASFVTEEKQNRFKKILNYHKELMPNKYIHVYSAFNGFAIYKTAIFLDCTYSATIKLSLFPKNILKKQISATNCLFIKMNRDDCEHRAFHLEAIQKHNARIRICTKSLFSKMLVYNPKLAGPA
jgi:hypothetical protein